jgi:hypothetical protein
MIDYLDAAFTLEDISPGFLDGVAHGSYRAEAGNDYASHPLIASLKKKRPPPSIWIAAFPVPVFEYCAT